MSMHNTNTIKLRNSSSLYFGKISSRGDFVKSTGNTNVIELIDQWVAKGMEILIANSQWKTSYDSTGPIDFLFLGTKRKHAICGSIIPSADASSRRFPLIAATLFDVDDSLRFLPLSPLTLERHVNHQRALCHHAASTHDAAEVLTNLSSVKVESELDIEVLTENYRHFLSHTTVAGLASALELEDDSTSIRQMVLALGYLMQPVLTNYAIAPQKGIAFPLPADPAKTAFVKTFWLDLTKIFLSRADFEVSIFSFLDDKRPKLAVTFNGVTAAVFHALFEKQAAQDHFIDVSKATWIEQYGADDPASLKLSSYLEHDALTLQLLLDTFLQSFVG